MRVRLISLTQGAFPIADLNESKTVRLIDGTLSPEELIAYAARVSNPSNQMNLETTDKLLGYLIKHKHSSPLEMVSMTLEVETSRGIAPQILRHRSFAFQEFSLRYAEAATREVYEARRQDSKNRQNSIDDLSEKTKKWFLEAQEETWITCYRNYQKALELGIAKEQARFLLPLTTQTKLYMCGTIRSWATYFLVRLEKGVQKEHKDIAIAAWKIFQEEFPQISASLKREYPEIFCEN